MVYIKYVSALKAKCLENKRICKTYITIYVNLKNTWLLNTDFTKITGEIVESTLVIWWLGVCGTTLRDGDAGPSINQHCVTISLSLGHQRFLSHEWALQDKGRRRVAPKGWLPANSFVMSLSRHLDVTPEDNRAVLPPYDVRSSDASVINFSAGRVRERGGGLADHRWSFPTTSRADCPSRQLTSHHRGEDNYSVSSTREPDNADKR